MLFWCFVLLFVAGIVALVVYDNTSVGEWCNAVGTALTVLTVIAIIISLTVFACNYMGMEGKLASKEQRYESLVYQYNNDVYDNDNDLGKKELMCEIQAWNEDISAKKANQDDFWIGIYVPNVWDQFELIELAPTEGN